MSTFKKFILLNTKEDPRRAFDAGASGIPTVSYQSQKFMLHITQNGDPVFLYKNVPVDFTDSYVFTRLRGNDSHFCGMLSEYFTHHKIPANDPIHLSYKGSAGKIAQMLLLTLAGIRVPETIIFREESFAANRTYIESHCTFPLVYKTDGSRGRRVHIVNSFAELEELVAKKKPQILGLIQPFIENTFDTRTLVIYSTILGAIKRTRSQGYLNNISQGAHADIYHLSESEQAVATRAAEACKIDIAGVDMIHTEAGPIVLEVNKSPQVQGFESVHHFKVFTRVAEIIRARFGSS